MGVRASVRPNLRAGATGPDSWSTESIWRGIGRRRCLAGEKVVEDQIHTKIKASPSLSRKWWTNAARGRAAARAGAGRGHAADGGVEVGVGDGVEVGAVAVLNLGSGRRRGCAESARRPTGDGGGESGVVRFGGSGRGEGRTRWLSQK